MILLVAMVVLAAGAAFAHGKEQHIMGKVTSMTDISITVQTKAKNPVTVYNRTPVPPLPRRQIPGVDPATIPDFFPPKS
jgi:hypothetical protein